ncbi:hypothetical protein [Streptomyces chartreusis]|uniref:hypothetical protein n=1 Tax=Streptomyces chartreusis TaxID=1969 RepID=UPI003643BD42
MTQPDEPYYVMYDGDFGLSGLAGRPTGARPPVPQGEAVGDEQVGVDARSLLESGLPEEMIRTLWLVADRGRFDPAGEGMTVRSWLTAWSEAFPPPPPKRPRHRKYISAITPDFFARPVPVETEMRDAVLAEIGAVEADLARAVPGVAEALRSAVAGAGADLGFRLLLRTLKACSVRVGKARHDRYVELSDSFEYCYAVIDDGLEVDWPPLDTDRRDGTWNFGLSELASRFAVEWHDRTRLEVVRGTAGSDDVGQTPGTAAALLLEDVTRLHASPLSDDTLTTLWLAASDCGLRPDRFGGDVRQWLEQIAEVCRERLREVAPDHDPAPARARARTAGADEVLGELRGLAPELASRTVQPHWQGVPGADAARALEQVVTLVDPDLGFRLFLRVLIALWMPLTAERYARFEALGERFGHGRYLVSEIDQFIQSDL